MAAALLSPAHPLPITPRQQPSNDCTHKVASEIHFSNLKINHASLVQLHNFQCAQPENEKHWENLIRRDFLKYGAIKYKNPIDLVSIASASLRNYSEQLKKLGEWLSGDAQVCIQMLKNAIPLVITDVAQQEKALKVWKNKSKVILKKLSRNIFPSPHLMYTRVLSEWSKADLDLKNIWHNVVIENFVKEFQFPECTKPSQVIDCAIWAIETFLEDLASKRLSGFGDPYEVIVKVNKVMTQAFNVLIDDPKFKNEILELWRMET